MSQPTAANTLPILVVAYAKINLSLRVLKRRPDGYHDIDSIMQTISLHDTLAIELTERISDIQLIVEMEDKNSRLIADDHSNLCYKTAKLYAEKSGLQQGIAIRLTKRIPVEAGLGGGSSDAASVLKGLNQLSDAPLSDNDLLELAGQIGADVAFFLLGGTCRVSGIGEIVEPLPDPEPSSFVIVKPQIGVPTIDAYSALDSYHSSTHDAGAGYEKYVNDFEEVIYPNHPEVAAARNLLTSSGFEHTLLCGSGSAVAGIIPYNVDKINELADIVRQKGQDIPNVSVFTCSTVARSQIA